MNSTHDATPNGAGNPNQEVISGLREVADWLDQHPELPPMAAAIHARAINAATARGELETVARALGDRAEEREEFGDVLIRGEFPGRVVVRAAADRPFLAGPRPLPPYEPIIARKAVAA